MMMPPQVIMQPQTGFWKSWGTAIIVTFSTLLLTGSLLLNFWLLVALAAQGAGGGSGFGSVSREVLTPGTATQTVAVLKFNGVIMDKSAESFINLVEEVAKDNNVKAVVVEVDSPGGSVTASDELYESLLKLKQDKGVPLFISMGSLAASGGYYMSMAGDEVYAQRTTLTGSIGVIFSRYDLSGMGDKYGIKDGSIISDGATFKNAGSTFSPLKPEEETYFKSVLNDSFATFKSVITAGRGNKLKGKLDDIANGKIYSAQQALALGLIDGANEDLSDVISKAATKAGLTSPQVMLFKREPTLADLLSGGAVKTPAGQTSGQVSLPGGVSVDPMQMRDLIHELTTPRLMYIWPG
jgi:protease IV